MLLHFSNALSSARDKKQLSAEFSEQLRKLGLLGDYSLYLISEDKKYHQIFLYNEQDHRTRYPNFSKILTTQYAINDGITDIVLNSEEPITFDIKELNQRNEVPTYVEWWAEMGLVYLTGISIRLGHENMGILWLSIPEEYNKVTNAPLLKNIASQLGISLSNILANEKILSQLEVIKTYKQQLEDEKVYLKEEIETTHNYSEIIGNGPEMQKIFHLVSKVAATDSTVLILGETGTGKELIARAIHNNSPRRNNLMIKVNCAALPVNLIESELFGHERGSFTGAIERRIGKFELANNGTLFLDEIGELPLELQVKLLRVLQEKEVERIGGKTTIKVNVRIIAATNRDLEKETAKGRFRPDLYYRLNIFPIKLPPLRLRVEDIPLLTSYFIQRFSKKLGKQINKISNRGLLELQHYNWPGNIRELKHLIERSILLTTDDTITDISLPSHEKQEVRESSQEYFSLKTIEENERDHILRMLKYCNGKIAGEGGAAQRLGVPASTLGSKIKRLGIKKEHFR
jgi:transcriptional regulator with GAF, ATPase, and Fis domain